MTTEDRSPPLVGITASEVHGAEHGDLIRYGEPAMPEMTLGLSYARAIQRAGGLPVVIPPVPVEAVSSLVAQLDAVVLSGGPDIHPGAYGADPHPELGPTYRELDIAELAIAGEAVARDLPLLGISRGAQTLNIARGGTLFQHLPERFGRGIHHPQPGGSKTARHAVHVEERSRLFDALGGVTELEVASYHHQATSGLGRGVEAAAWAPDGVVEAIEVPDATFAIGVQWHAESMLDDPSQLRLFGALVRAAGDAENRSSRVTGSRRPVNSKRTKYAFTATM